MANPLDYRPPRRDPPEVSLGERVLATVVTIAFAGFFLLIVVALFGAI